MESSHDEQRSRRQSQQQINLFLELFSWPLYPFFLKPTQPQSSSNIRITWGTLKKKKKRKTDAGFPSLPQPEILSAMGWVGSWALIIVRSDSNMPLELINIGLQGVSLKHLNLIYPYSFILKSSFLLPSPSFRIWIGIPTVLKLI